MIERNINDVIFGLVTAIVMVIVIFLGMGVRNATEDTMPTIDVGTTNTDLVSQIFTSDVVAILVAFGIIGILAIIIHIGRMYQGWN